jgi:hypothetical protein
MKHLRIAVVVLAVTAPLPSSGQAIHVGRNVLVYAAPPDAALIEPHLAAHPTLPGHLVGGVIVSDTAAPPNRSFCARLLSTDAGAMWWADRSPVTPCADPWVAITGSGEAVFLALGIHPALGVAGQYGLVSARSPDGGRTWSDTLLGLGVGHDRPTMAVDPRPGADRAIVVFSGLGLRIDDGPLRWSVYIARSINAARSYREPAKLIPSNLNLNSEEGVILRDGTILASFVDFQRNVGGFERAGGMLERRRIWMLRSTDGGRSFTPPLFVTEHCGRSSYDVAADPSDGPSAGRVYLGCRSRDGSGILIHHSDDKGETWSSPRLVSRDTTGAFRTQPRLAVNKDGAVGIVWLDGGTEGAGTCYRVVAAVSTDGGEAFTAAHPVSPRACPDPARNGFAYRRWQQGGDYFGWAAAADGRFHALWTDGRRGPFELWTAVVTILD